MQGLQAALETALSNEPGVTCANPLPLGVMALCLLVVLPPADVLSIARREEAVVDGTTLLDFVLNALVEGSCGFTSAMVPAVETVEGMLMQTRAALVAGFETSGGSGCSLRGEEAFLFLLAEAKAAGAGGCVRVGGSQYARGRAPEACRLALTNSKLLVLSHALATIAEIKAAFAETPEMPWPLRL